MLACLPRATWASGRAKGKYVSFLDSDDLFLPDELAQQVAYLEAHPEVGLLYTPYVSVDSTVPGRSILRCRTGAIQLEILRQCTIATPTVMIPAMVLAEVGGFDEQIGTQSEIRICGSGLPGAMPWLHCLLSRA